MAKIQEIKRKDGTNVNPVNIPQQVMEDMGWKKGDELDFIVAINEKVENKKIVKVIKNG